MVKVSLRVNSDEWRAALETYPERIRAAFARGLNRAGEIVARDASKRLTQPGPSGFSSIFTGTLLRAMSAGWRVDPKALTLRVGPGLAALSRDVVNYGFFVEHGRRPGKRPPARVLELWVKRKLGIGDPNENRRVSIAIADKIGREGTPASPFLEPAVRGNLSAMREAIQGEVDGEIRRLNAEGRG